MGNQGHKNFNEKKRDRLYKQMIKTKNKQQKLTRPNLESFIIFHTNAEISELVI